MRQRHHKAHRRLLAALLVGPLLGCASLGLGGCTLHTDLETVEFRQTGPDGGLDAADAEDAAGDADATPDTGQLDAADVADAADADADAADAADGDADAVADAADADDTDADADADAAGACVADMGEVVGGCTGVDGCPDATSCGLALVVQSGQADRYETTCIDDASREARGEWEACDVASECAPGLHCVNWLSPEPRERVCSKLCVLETGEGCEAGEFCTNPWPDLLSGLGFCTPTCDPLDPASCGAGESCAPDPNYPEQTCQPHLRCLNNFETPAKAPGDSCSRADHQSDGCPSGLVCTPSSAGEVCAEPCATDADCDDASCVDAPAPWPYRYCALQ